jgi:GTP-binding protein Era
MSELSLRSSVFIGGFPAIRNAQSAMMKSGYIAIVGRPNVGKSTLLNALLDDKISAVSPKPQTTRQRVVGIANGADYQMLFLDTPGILKPRYPLQKLMEKEIDLALADADVVLLVVEPGLSPSSELPAPSPRSVVAINKIDTVAKPELLPVIQHYAELGYDAIVPISALKGDGVAGLRDVLKSRLPEGEPFYPQDQLTTQPEKFFVGELIREAIFASYGEEIPYSTIVEVVEFKEREGRKDFIQAVIYVEKASQKAILIGHGGEALKRLGSRARERIEVFLERPVYLELWVKVKEGWRKDEAFIRERFRER